MSMIDRKIEFGPDKIEIDAEIVARTLKITPEDLRARMRDGTVTSQFERGEGSDEGRVRLTFYSATHRARIIADTTGTVLSRSVAQYGRPTLPSTQDAATKPKDSAAQRSGLDALLDAALQDTFPASDPVAISFELPQAAQKTPPDAPSQKKDNEQ